MMTAVVLLLILLGLALLWIAQRVRARIGLPPGRIVAADMGPWRRLDRPLYSHRHRLIGRPDYIVADGADLIPVEVKSARAPAQPYASHVLQLAAYCLLVAETSGRRPPYGLLRYADRTFRVPFTRELEEEVLALLAAMRKDLDADEVPRRHQDPRRCQRCGYRDVCDQALA